MKSFLQKVNWMMLLSFFIPVISLGSIFAYYEIYPFGKQSLLTSDMNNQYIHFYSTYLHLLKDFDSFFYSWSGGLGMNFLGLFSYYLGSPFLLLLYFFNQANLTEGVLIITLLKVGTAGFTFFIFLAKGHLFSPKSSLLFSTSYALMSYTLVYSFNLMWLDGVYLLPLILYGLERMFKGKYILFTVSLAVLFISNFYIAYMVGIYTFLYFVIRLLGLKEKQVSLISHCRYYVGLFFGCVILAVGLSAIIILPTILALQTIPSNPKSMSFEITLMLDFVQLYTKQYIGSYDTLMKGGYPNIFSGLLSLLLFSIFFFNKEIKSTEKVLWGCLVVFLIFSFQLPGLDLLWHGFDQPTGFPYRYSFVFSFTMLFLAAKSFHHLSLMELTPLNRVLWFNLFLLLFLPTLGLDVMKNDKVLLLNILLLIGAYMLLYWYTSISNHKEIVVTLMIVLNLITMVSNGWIAMNKVNQQFGYNTKDSYSPPNDTIRNTYETIMSEDSSFYRIESQLNNNRNDPMKYNYKGISHFSSLSYGHLNQTLNKLGFTTLGNLFWVNNNGSTLVTESMFAQKYIVTSKNALKVRGIPFGYIIQQEIEDLVVLKNQHELPLGMMLPTDELEMCADCTNPFERQNAFFGAEVFKRVNVLNETVLNLDKKGTEKGTVYSSQTPTEKANIRYDVALEEPTQLYMYLSASDYNGDVNIYVDGKKLDRYMHIFNNNLLDLGYIDSTQVSITIEPNKDDFTLDSLEIYTLDTKVFTSQIERFKENSLRVTDFTNTSIKGTIQNEKDGWLYFSIPYDNGWEIKVNGQQTDSTIYFNSFLAVELPKGNHDIELNYMPPGFKLGASVTGISGLLILILIFRKFFWRKKHD